MSGMGTMIPETAASANKNAAPLGQGANINKVSTEYILLQECQGFSLCIHLHFGVRPRVTLRRVLGHFHQQNMHSTRT